MALTTVTPSVNANDSFCPIILSTKEKNLYFRQDVESFRKQSLVPSRSFSECPVSCAGSATHATAKARKVSVRHIVVMLEAHCAVATFTSTLYSASPHPSADGRMKKAHRNHRMDFLTLEVKVKSRFHNVARKPESVWSLQRS